MTMLPNKGNLKTPIAKRNAAPDKPMQMPTTAEITKAYEEGDDSQKKLLEKLYPNMKLNNDIREKIKTVEDAILELGIGKTHPVIDIINYTGKDAYMNEMKHYMKLSIIIKALNQGWVPDFSNSNENKWYVYMYYKSGSGLAYTVVDYWFTDTAAGARLALKTKELAEYAGKQFEQEYKNHFSL